MLKKIAPGSTLGVIALSSPCESKRLKAGLDYLTSLGFKLKVALDPSAAYGSNKYLFSSDTPNNRANALKELFLDPEVGAIIAARGAYGSMEILELLDYVALRNSTKPLIGFSDTTAVLLALFTNSGIISIHGPSIESAFTKAASGEEDAKQSCQALIDLLTAKEQNPFADWKLKPFKQGASGEGKLIGGNLSVFTSLLGTKWLPNLNGAVLFLEESGEKPYRIHRMLMQLKLSGGLSGVRGVVLGGFRDCVHPRGLGPSVLEVFSDFFGKEAFPVLSGAPFGHETLNLPVPLGVQVKISNTKLDITTPLF